MTPNSNRFATVPCLLAGKLEPTIIYTLSKMEADEIGASLGVHRQHAGLEHAVSACLTRKMLACALFQAAVAVSVFE